MKADKINKSTQSKYPFDLEHYDSLNTSKKELINNLLYLFTFYCGKASKNMFKDIQEKYFVEMMCQVWLMAGHQATKYKKIWNDIYILFYTKGKKTLDFSQFLSLLPTLSYYFEPDLSKKEAMKSLLHHLIEVYKKKVLPEIDGKVINFKLHVRDKTAQYITKLFPQFTTVYKYYFAHEILSKFRSNEKKFRAGSLDKFFEMMKDFDIFPKLISSRDLFYVYQESSSSILEQVPTLKDKGEYFTLSRMIESLMMIGRRVYGKLKEVDNVEEEGNEYQKQVFRTLLEYMQTVKAVKRINRPLIFSQVRFSFILLEEHPETQQMKTVLVKDRLIREPISELDFYAMIDDLEF